MNTLGKLLKQQHYDPVILFQELMEVQVKTVNILMGILLKRYMHKVSLMLLQHLDQQTLKVLGFQSQRHLLRTGLMVLN